MKRFIITVAATVLAAVPATVGLLGNASFSETVPVRVPAGATIIDRPAPTGTTSSTKRSVADSTWAQVRADDYGDDRTTSTRHSEPGDDHGGDRTTTAGTTRHSEPDDDHGGSAPADDTTDDRSSSTATGDNHGSNSDVTSGERSSDDGDRGGSGSGRGGKDDGSDHS